MCVCLLYEKCVVCKIWYIFRNVFVEMGCTTFLVLVSFSASALCGLLRLNLTSPGSGGVNKATLTSRSTFVGHNDCQALGIHA